MKLEARDVRQLEAVQKWESVKYIYVHLPNLAKVPYLDMRRDKPYFRSQAS